MKFVVLGGGVSGLFASYYLLKAGHDVIVVDDGQGPVRTSAYNAGQLSGRSNFTAIFGDGSGVRISRAQRRSDPRWFNLARRQTRGRYERVCLELVGRSLALYQGILDEAPSDLDVMEEMLELHTAMPKYSPTGVSGGRLLSPDEISSLGYAGFEGGWLLRERSLHPGRLIGYLHSRLSSLGGRYRRGRARLKPSGSKIAHAAVGDERIHADGYVVAGGSWSRAICRPLGYDPMVVPARGLVILCATRGARAVDCPATYSDEGVTVTQHDRETVRLTGFFELMGFNHSFSQARRDQLFKAVTSHLSRRPRLERGEVGVGFRPTTPDQLPSVGRIPKFENGYILTGSSRKGIVLAPELARLLSRVVLDPQAEVDWALAALDPGRFGGLQGTRRRKKSGDREL